MRVTMTFQKQGTRFRESELPNNEKKSCMSLLKRNHLSWGGVGVDTQQDNDGNLLGDDKEIFTHKSTFSI